VGGTIGLPDPYVSILSDAIFVTGLAAVGLKVLLTPDPEWETEPVAVRSAQPVVAAIRQPS
jgi:hypothetical protein